MHPNSHANQINSNMPHIRRKTHCLHSEEVMFDIISGSDFIGSLQLFKVFKEKNTPNLKGLGFQG
jgi:hypothetical protein